MKKLSDYNKIILEEISELKDLLKNKLIINNLPPYLRVKDIVTYFNIGRDSVYKYVIPRAVPRTMGRLKLYKTEEIIEVIESYKEFLPEITWPI